MRQLPAPLRDLLVLLGDGRFHSGVALGAEFGVGRAALWRRVARLREFGVAVEAVPRRGYRLPEPVEPLCAQAVRAALGQAAAPTIDLEVAFSVSSTNSLLVEEARRGALEHPRALLAEVQSAGRGRWGRVWRGGYGAGLYVSLAWPFPRLKDSAGGASLAVGAALATYLEATGLADIGLKWPNDLVTPRGKLGGVLLELVGDPGGPCTVVIGVGLNYRLSSGILREIDQSAVGLVDELSAPAVPGRNALAAGVLTALAEACAAYPRHGLAASVERWERYDVLLGQDVCVTLPEGELRGAAAGIGPDGALLIRSPAGVTRCVSGDVQLRVRR